MQSLSDELLQKTQQYWRLSSVWNGRLKEEIPCGEAISDCSQIINTTYYIRPVAISTDCLLQELIKGQGSGKNSQPQIISFPERHKA